MSSFLNEGTGGSGGGTIGGSLAVDQIGYGSSANTLTGDVLFTRDDVTGELNMVTDFGGYTGGFGTNLAFAPAAGLPVVYMYKGVLSTSPSDTGVVAIVDTPDGQINTLIASSSKADGTSVGFQASAYAGYGVLNASNFDSSLFGTISVLNTGAIINQVNDGGIFLIQGSGSNYVFSAQPGATPYVAGGDIQNLHNNLSFTADDGSSQWTVRGLKQVTYPTPSTTFTGTGLNDLTLGGSFTGSGSVTYSATVDGTNVSAIQISNVTGIISVGDTIQGNSSLVTATVVSITEGPTGVYSVVLSAHTGFFINGEGITDTTSGALGNATTGELLSDTWTIFDGASTFTQVPDITGSIGMLYGIKWTIGSGIGHTIGDSWTGTYVPVNIYGRMEFLDGNNQGQTFGDVDGVSSGENIYIHQNLNGKHGIFNNLGAGGAWAVTDLGNGGNTILEVDDSDFNFNDPFLGNGIIHAGRNGGFPQFFINPQLTGNVTAFGVDDSTGFIYLTGSQNVRILSVAADSYYNVALGNYIIEMNPVTTDVGLVLPLSPNAGDTYIVKNKQFTTFDVVVSAGSYTIDGSSTDTIAGSVSVQTSKTYTFNGTEWSIF